MRKITKIIVHCTATAEGRNYTVDDVRRWHTTPVSQGGRGWKDIGYHYLVYLDGSVHPGRPESEVGAHCKGQNQNSIGICYVGGLSKDLSTPKDTRTPGQREALRQLVANLRRKYPGATLHGHREFAAKACPCFDVKTDL